MRHDAISQLCELWRSESEPLRLHASSWLHIFGGYPQLARDTCEHHLRTSKGDVESHATVGSLGLSFTLSDHASNDGCAFWVT